VAGLTIRPEQPDDHDAIAEVTTAAFGRNVEARMIDAIRDSDGYVPELSLVAVQDVTVVGHAILSYVGLESRPERLLELGPIAVAPEHQRQGIGSALIGEALARADRRQEPLLLVLGHPAYYPRFGFRPAAELGLYPPDEAIPTEAFMAIPLTAYDGSPAGRVVFPAAYSLA
jgi:predicted N-acetyltransferase YhbS